MIKSHGVSRIGVMLLVAVFLNAILMPGIAASKESDCDFDKKKPALVHAQKVFDSGDFRCAEVELNALIKDKKTNLEDRAAARILLVKVYNAMIHEDLNKPVDQPAAEPVEKPAPPPPPPAKDTVVEKQPAAVVKSPVLESKTGGKPWYKKWWAMALGVGVVAAVAVAAGGGGDTPEEEEPNTLASPPPPPSK